MINSFRGDFDFLSNFYEAPVEYNGLLYRNNEAAFQAQKVLDRSERERFVSLAASTAKRLGRKVTLRSDWEEVKFQIMSEICAAKFMQNPELATKLVATGDELLIEVNTWGDKYWGVCKGMGKNNLGKILMTVRKKLAENC